MFNGSLGVLCRGRGPDRWSFCLWVVETAMLQDGFGALAQKRPPRWPVAVGTTSYVPSVVKRANLEVAYQVRQLLYSPSVGDL